MDDERFVLLLLKSILEPQGYAVEMFEQAEKLLERLTQGDAGCIITDLKMPGMGGLELQREIVRRGLQLPILFISGRASVPEVVIAMKQGALDFLVKPIMSDELLGAIERARRMTAQREAQHRACEDIRRRWRTLSPREQIVCKLSASGLLNKQVAAELGIRESTVQAQRSRAMNKLGVSNLVELLLVLDQIDDEE